MHEECSGTEQCSKQAHTITAQILPDGFSLPPGAVELEALRSSTLFFSALIGEAAPDFSALADFFIKTSREFSCYFAASLIFVACHATVAPTWRRSKPMVFSSASSPRRRRTDVLQRLSAARGD